MHGSFGLGSNTGQFFGLLRSTEYQTLRLTLMNRVLPPMYKQGAVRKENETRRVAPESDKFDSGARLGAAAAHVSTYLASKTLICLGYSTCMAHSMFSDSVLVRREN